MSNLLQAPKRIRKSFIKSISAATLVSLILLFTAMPRAGAVGVTYKSTTSANNNVASTLSLSVPAGTVPGDVLLATLDVENSPTITMPGGWTLVRSDRNPGALHMVQADYIHVVTGSEPSAYTWNFSAAHGASGGIIAYSGVDTSQPIDAASGFTATTSSSQITAPSVNVSLPNSMLVAVTGVGVTRTLTPPTGMTSRYVNGTTVAGEKTTIMAADQQLAAAGATGSRSTTYDVSTAGAGIAQLIALRPALATDTTPPSVPTAVAQISNTTTSATVSWTASTDNVAVAGYTAYNNGVVAGTTASTSFVFPALSCGTSYNVSIDAYDAAGNHSARAPINVSTASCPDTTPPTDPTGLVQTGSTDASVSLGWSASTDNVAVAGYTVYLNGGALTPTTTSTSYTVTGLTCGNTYNLFVDAFDAVGNHSNQVPVSASTNACPVIPAVSITSPSDSATVSGQVAIDATASDSNGIVSVQFNLDGNPLGSPVTVSPYTINWDTTAVTDGQHTLTATATDNNNVSNTSNPVGVTVNNGSQNVPAPIVDSVVIDQTSPMTNDTLTATVTAHDPSGRNLTYIYQWIKNGVHINGATNSTLDLSVVGNGNKSDSVTLEVVADNGASTSAAVLSSPVTIINSAPAVSVNLSSTTPDTDATVTATATPNDADGDAVTLTYVWKVNSNPVKNDVTANTISSLDLSLPGNGNYGDSITLSVTANDGTATSSPANSSATITKPPTGTILEYSVSALGTPSGITKGPDGNLWFSVESGSSVGRITPSGVVTQYMIPQAGNLGGINAGADGNIWFTEFTNNKISKINPTTFTITRYSLATNSGVGGIAAGSDGNMWFLESSSNKIGRITPSGAITLFTVPTAGAFPHGLNPGPDGNIWFAEVNVGKIGKITPSGAITEYRLPVSTSKPYVIAAGPDGNMWFTEYNGNKVGRITLTGTVTEFNLPHAGSKPFGIFAGPDGNLWFTENANNKIGRITTNGVITEYTVPTGASKPDKIVSGPDGNLWFTEQSGLKIGRITP